MLKRKKPARRKVAVSWFINRALEDSAKILQLEREVLRLRGVIDAHEKEAEARYRGRAEAAEREVNYANERASYATAHREAVDRQVAELLEPLKPLFLLMKRLWPEDAC